MARNVLFEFKHDAKTVTAYTGSSSEVFYVVGSSSSKSSGLKYNEKNGTFTSGSGKSLKFDEAKSYLRNKL